jgi:hypothetical protein
MSTLSVLALHCLLLASCSEWRPVTLRGITGGADLHRVTPLIRGVHPAPLSRYEYCIRSKHPCSFRGYTWRSLAACTAWMSRLAALRLAIPTKFAHPQSPLSSPKLLYVEIPACCFQLPKLSMRGCEFLLKRFAHSSAHVRATVMHPDISRQC